MSDGYLRVCKFSELQHYADRPDNPWIKYYVRLLDDEEMNALPVATRLLWDRLLLLAQRYANVIPNDSERLAGLTAIPVRDVHEGIQQLLEGRWLSHSKSPRRASKRASKDASKSASPHARIRPEAETDTYTEAELLERDVSGGSNAEVVHIREVLRTQFPDYTTTAEGGAA